MKTGRKARLRHWQDEYYLKAYELAKGGMEDENIAITLGVKGSTFRKWILELPALQEALEKARRGNDKGGVETFHDYVYGRLPPRLKQMWEEIHGDGFTDPDSMEAACEKLNREPQLHKMQMFLYAFVSCNFSLTEACRKLGFNKTMVISWAQRNPQFAEMLQEIQECKKDFFESALIDLVKKGDASAILFANRTINRNRGYNDKIEIDGKMEHTHTHKVKLEDLGLPVEVMKQVRDATRKKQIGYVAAEEKKNVLDAEYEETKK